MTVGRAKAPLTGRVVLGCFIGVIAIWGTTWYGMKVSVESFPPLIAAGLRFCLAFPLLAAAVALRPDWRLLPPAGSRWLVGVLTVSYVSIPYALINYGEQHTASGLAAIIFASVTVLLPVMSVVLGIARVSITQWVAIGIGLALLALLVVQSGQEFTVSSPLGPLAIFAAACLHATSYALIARYGRDVDVVSLEVLPIGLGGALLLVFGTIADPSGFAHASGRSWLAVLYLAGVASVLGFAAYFYLLQRMSPVLLSFVFVFFPIVAVGISVPLEGQKLSAVMVVLAAGVLGAFAIAKLKGAADPTSPGDPDDGPLSRDALADVAREAEESFPAECCGFIHQGAVRPARNVAPVAADEGAGWHRSREQGYVLSLADVLYLDESMATDHPVEVIYHSHPNGRAYFSDEDRAFAVVDGREVFPGVRHLVVGVDAGGVREAALYSLDSGAVCEVWRSSTERDLA